MFISRIALRKSIATVIRILFRIPSSFLCCRKGNGFGAHAFHRGQICALFTLRILIIRRILYLTIKLYSYGL